MANFQDGLHHKFLPLVWDLARRMKALGIPMHLISGLRTWEQQKALYAQGRTKPGRRVTDAKPGYSYHNYGLAADWGRVDGKPLSEADWQVFGQEVKRLRNESGALLVWGGTFPKLHDVGHVELHLAGKSISQMRKAALAKGKP